MHAERGAPGRAAAALERLVQQALPELEAHFEAREPSDGIRGRVTDVETGRHLVTLDDSLDGFSLEEIADIIITTVRDRQRAVHR